MDKRVRKRGNSLMRKLGDLIETELKKHEVCAVYNSELARVWPKRISETKRKQAIERFAKQHALAVTFYDVGLCAIFEKPHAPAGSGKRVLLLEGEQPAEPRRTR